MISFWGSFASRLGLWSPMSLFEHFKSHILLYLHLINRFTHLFYSLGWHHLLLSKLNFIILVNWNSSWKFLWNLMTLWAYTIWTISALGSRICRLHRRWWPNCGRWVRCLSDQKSMLETVSPHRFSWSSSFEIPATSAIWNAWRNSLDFESRHAWSFVVFLFFNREGRLSINRRILAR